MSSQFRRFTLSFLAAFVLLGASAQAGTVVADSGFRPDPDGFSFANYGDDEGYKNLNVAEVRKIFGNGVCLSGKASKCVLNPAVRSWMDQINDSMAGGHCYGFATLSSLILGGDLPRFGFSSIEGLGGGPTTFDLGIESNVVLQRSIARAFSAQYLPSVTTKTVISTPKDVINQLVADLGSEGAETWNFGIYQWGMKGGHAITPYAVEDMGAGKFDVHVYDNNFPNDADRRLTVDTVKNTWGYYATTKPGNPAAQYTGNAKSKTLRLMPVTPGLGIQPCEYCVGRQGAKSKHNQITLSSSGSEHASLLITDQKGRKTGFQNGRLVNQIPGAQVLPRSSGGPQISADGTVESINSLEPVYRIPKNLKLKIRIDGRRMTYQDREDLNVVGPTFDATVEDVRVGPGKVAHVTLSPKKQTLSFTGSKGESSPTVTFGAESDRAAYRINVSAPGAPSRSTFFFAKKPNYGLLRIGSKSSAAQKYRVMISRFDTSGQSRFARSYSIRGKQQAFLYYAPLARKNGVARVAIGEPGKQRIKVLKLRKVS
ncbi:MAG: hypothetical protein M3Y23_05360 [Actinomycetota bacterium]|nr:hypothetical protein [Actinomycetota bacterium]